jgi:DNA-binding response OmpR family regulator
VTRILVVEDNESLAFGLRNNLEIEGYDVAVEGDGTEGLAAARSDPPDLIVLDLMLPGLDGFRFLRKLREDDAHTPVLILTARGEETDKVRGLKLGADDYVTKPFGVMELLARVEALLRRTRTGNGGEANAASHAARMQVERFGDVQIDPAARVVRRNGQPVDLTPKEFDLLLALSKRQGTVATRLELMREVWGYSSAVVSRTVDTHIAELRRKIEENPSAPKHILTVRKSGYRLQG